MSTKKAADRHQLDRTGETLDYDAVRSAMKYLGYIDGPQMCDTARALAGKVCVSVVLPSLIAEEYARAGHRRATGAADATD